MDDPSLARHTDALVESLHAVEKVTSSIRRSTVKLVTAKDIARERVKVRAAVDLCTEHQIPAAHDSLKYFDKYLRLYPQHSQSYKLVQDAKAILSAYQAACDDFYRRCCEVDEAVSKQRRTSKGAPRRDDDDDETEAHELSERQPFLTSGASTATEQEVQRNLRDEIMEERNREVREIAESVRDIHEIFTHINELVGEQGEKLDTLEANVRASEASTRKASEQLRLAREASDRSKRNQVIALILVIIVVGIVVAIMLA